ncbi:MAG: mcpA [Caulobacteraceae bacterium]|nr:mcpA [Caulobacteraceae bacterium]
MGIPGAGFINGRMSMGARLALLSVFFIIPTAILLTMFVFKSWGDIKMARREQAGAQYMSSIWPAYREAAQPLRTNGEALSQFTVAHSGFDDRMGTASEAQVFAAASGQARLKAGLDLIATLADASGLALDHEAGSNAVVQATTISLPQLIDDTAALGQAIALPAGPERQAQVAETLQRIRTSTEELDVAYGDAVRAEPKVLGSLSARADALKAAAGKLDAHRSALLADAPAATVQADLEALQAEADQTWRAGQDALEAMLAKRVADLIADLALNLAVVAVAMAMAAALATTIAKGLSGRIAALLKVMDRLVAGDVAVDVPHLEDRNETGRIAASVGVFKQSLIDADRLRSERGELDARAEQQRLAEQAREAAGAKEQAQVVSAIAEGLDKLSAGVLTYRIATEFASAYEKLRADFNAAMQQLQNTMKVVADNAQGIRSGAGEISQASDDLSRRTEQQAASLEETAAALDQITATVRKTAEGSGQARETVSVAKSDAENSGRVVQEAIRAMGEIEDSAHQIGKIIGVIDEIAFQTNLLALNAGVEAARAGDAGKGFAVVASEVRALAQRSAEAAKEIKTLISASSQQVGRGVSLVGETGKALERIVVQVGEINGVVAEIAASAQEQAAGLAQVNTAVNQMDQVTQQNAAMVEQSTAASHALAHEAEELSRLISGFQLGPRDSAHPVRTPVAAKSHAPVTALKTLGQRGVSAAVRQDEPGWDEF